ncbi:MAG: peptide deformylase [Burkholderiales bacterium]|nr:peptide deformylase [Burkholderiales bacterium]
MLPILKYPDKRLHTVAKPVQQVDDTIRSLVDDMAETMYAAPGIGLAATQVNVHKRVIVMDISETKDQLLVLINPEIVQSSGRFECEEGCLSVPGIFEKVTRAEDIRVKALDRDGNGFEFDANGLLSICVQHEMDHLQGKIFVEYLSPLKQDRILKKLRKAERLAI